MEFFELLRNRSKQEWREAYRELVCNSRIWIHEHGEFAFLWGLALGIVVVLLFKFVLTLLVVAAILGFTVWSFAPEHPAAKDSDEKPGSQSGDSPSR